ncbi:MAG: helix-turn-helix transcriptional regulator [Acidimicrobiales bacterium]
MGFPENLARLRRERGLTQAALAESLDVLANQISLYESGKTEPSLGVLRQLAVALSVSCDDLVFGGDRLDDDPSLEMAFEATLLLNPDEQATVRALLDAFLAAHRQRHGRGEGPRAKKQPSK